MRVDSGSHRANFMGESNRVYKICSPASTYNHGGRHALEMALSQEQFGPSSRGAPFGCALHCDNRPRERDGRAVSKRPLLFLIPSIFVKFTIITFLRVDNLAKE